MHNAWLTLHGRRDPALCLCSGSTLSAFLASVPATLHQPSSPDLRLWNSLVKPLRNHSSKHFLLLLTFYEWRDTMFFLDSFSTVHTKSIRFVIPHSILYFGIGQVISVESVQRAKPWNFQFCTCKATLSLNWEEPSFPTQQNSKNLFENPGHTTSDFHCASSYAPVYV